MAGVFIVTGAWTFAELPRVAAGLATPWMGVKERIGIYGYMLWMAMLAIVLLSAQVNAIKGKRSASIATPELTAG